jgi:hypothetical protein
MKFRPLLSLISALLTGSVLLVKAEPVVQVPTETPAEINLQPAVQAQATTDLGGPTETRTPTPLGVALLEAKEFANVRAEPSTEAAQLGTIRVGETYNVIGRYVSWIQFEYRDSPTGRGWVFGELVNLSGNTENIPEIDPFAGQTAVDDISAGATQTQGVLTQTPGGVLTATLAAQQLSLPGVVTATLEGTRAVLPTFTYPPGMVALAPTAGAAETTSEGNTQTVTQTPTSDGVPPLVPIVLLGAAGLLGLAISSLRRG